MRKFISLAFILLLIATCLTGCNKNKDEVYYLNFKPEVAEVYQRIVADYKRETGKSIRVVTAASGTYEQTLKSEISKKNAPTIFQFNGPIGYQAWKNYCADLQYTDIYKMLNDKDLAIKDESGVWGIPYVVEGYGIIYNKEITDKYFALSDRATSISSMEDIRSYDMLKMVVEDMTSRKSELGIDGVFASTSLQAGENWRWTTHLANIAMHQEFDDNGTNLTQLENVKEVAFKYEDEFKNIFDLYLNNSTTDRKLLGSKQVADSMAEFALGKCAMVQNGNWAWGQINQIAGNRVKKENIRMIPIFTGLANEEKQGICIGTENYLAINRHASEEKQKAAADFLYWLYSSDTGKKYVTQELNFIAPFETFNSDNQPDDPLTQQIIEWMGKGDVKNITWDFLIFPSQNFKDIFGAALLQYAQGTKSWDEVVQTFILTWKSESSN